jgi:hypothetical protein
MKKTFTATIFLTLFSLSASPALALTGVWDGVACNRKGICGFCDMVKVGANITDLLIELTFAVAAFMIVVGAIMMMISAGNQNRYELGKKFVTNAILGIFIALASWIIVNTVFHLMTGNPNYPWNSISC